MTRLEINFLALVIVQAAHSVEEYFGRLWEVFPPAIFVTGLISKDREFGFLVINITLVAFGLWCFFWPVRRRWPSARLLMGAWVVIELINGVGHPLWSIQRRGYTPGVITALLLLVLALSLMWQLQRGTDTFP
jgi:Protein of unknown function with HXXEE motif